MKEVGSGRDWSYPTSLIGRQPRYVALQNHPPSPMRSCVRTGADVVGDRGVGQGSCSTWGQLTKRNKYHAKSFLACAVGRSSWPLTAVAVDDRADHVIDGSWLPRAPREHRAHHHRENEGYQPFHECLNYPTIPVHREVVEYRVSHGESLGQGILAIDRKCGRRSCSCHNQSLAALTPFHWHGVRATKRRDVTACCCLLRYLAPACTFSTARSGDLPDRPAHLALFRWWNGTVDQKFDYRPVPERCVEIDE